MKRDANSSARSAVEVQYFLCVTNVLSVRHSGDPLRVSRVCSMRNRTNYAGLSFFLSLSQIGLKKSRGSTPLSEKKKIDGCDWNFISVNFISLAISSADSTIVEIRFALAGCSVGRYRIRRPGERRFRSRLRIGENSTRAAFRKLTARVGTTSLTREVAFSTETDDNELHSRWERKKEEKGKEEEETNFVNFPR